MRKLMKVILKRVILTFKFCSSAIDEVLEITIDRISCYFPRTKHFRPSTWPCNILDEEDGAMFL